MSDNKMDPKIGVTHFEPTVCDKMDFETLMLLVEAAINAHARENPDIWRPIALSVMGRVVDMYDNSPGIIHYGCDFQTLNTLVVLIKDEARPKLSDWLTI